MTLLSMTGFGEARTEQADHAVNIELRTINSRHFKLSLRSTDGYGSLDARIEAILRESIRRGTVHANLKIRHLSSLDDFRINAQMLERYVDELQKIAAKRDLCEELRLEPLASLPGVVEQLSTEASEPEDVWPVVKAVVTEALEKLTKMRAEEGEALAADLTEQCQTVAKSLDIIAQRTEVVVDHYRQRLLERVGGALSELQVTLEPADLTREVCLFAERSDISEEVVRLRSHLQQFEKTMQLPESSGRKLEFICQEMGRETNTIGSKANDAEISAQVVEIKTALERIREQIQNVE
ncbi:YicC/YloC family endoribonuclease [Adhaeretor mobilis]|uniref:YicC family protein n=1 Tax=Adhaeretor mobilis TaxID=1930276 RepID=A0A517MVR9_9BACT|nr:YicC/YloC family endoribonuclease [Adhaeretor mobilis]QDS98897.1 Conserved hypothetical protein CHP00255 [Adhaeretor mobilis]